MVSSPTVRYGRSPRGQCDALSGLGTQAGGDRAGELVIDAWGGIADAETAWPVDGDTLFNV